MLALASNADDLSVRHAIHSFPMDHCLSELKICSSITDLSQILGKRNLTLLSPNLILD